VQKTTQIPSLCSQVSVHGVLHAWQKAVTVLVRCRSTPERRWTGCDWTVSERSDCGWRHRVHHGPSVRAAMDQGRSGSRRFRLGWTLGGSPGIFGVSTA